VTHGPPKTDSRPSGDRSTNARTIGTQSRREHGASVLRCEQRSDTDAIDGVCAAAAFAARRAAQHHHRQAAVGSFVAASEREYMEWLNNRPYFEWLERPDRHLDDSYEAFMAVRRSEREAARLQALSAQRTQQRREQPSAAALQRQREYFDWLQELPDPARDDDERDDTWAAFMLQRRQLQQQRRNEARRTGGKRGRPINPNSRRQQQLAANISRRAAQLQRKLERQAAEDALWASRIEELKVLGAVNVELFGKKPTTVGDYYWHMPASIQLPVWVFNEAGYTPCVPADVPERIRLSLGPTKRMYEGRDYGCEHTEPLGTLVRLKLTHVLRNAIKASREQKAS